MRILQVNTEKTWRGGERQTLYTLEGLIQKGIDAHLLTVQDSPMHQRAEEKGMPVIAVKNSLETFKVLSRLRGRFHCIHAQTGKAHAQCILTKLFHQTPVLYTRRVDFIPSGAFTRMKYKLTDQVVSISPAIARILQKSGMCEHSPIISSAVKDRRLDINRANQLRQALNLKDSTKIIGLVAALESHKDPITAVQTIKHLSEIRQDFAALHFGDGAMSDQVSKAISALGLENIYHQMGYHNNVEDYFSIMNVFLMSSAEEGLGSSVLDAFSYNVGVVSTNAGGLKDLVQDRGFLCNVRDVNCLSKSLNLALDGRDQFFEYRAKAKTYCDNEMGVDLMTTKYIVLYQEMVHE